MPRDALNIMDIHVKAGQVYLQHRNVEKKWKQHWLTLYPSSRCGVARLERQEVGGGERAGPSGVWKHQDKVKEKRVIRLSEVIRVLRLPPHAEACPKDNMAAFCVETDGRRFVFAADKDDCVEWVERMCDLAFQGGSTGQQPQIQMEDNQIYVSREEISEFRVGVKQTDVAMRCGLQGEYYWLQVAQDGLVLKEAETRKSLQDWPYRLIRRYGRDKLTFNIEAGRRCDSGPGTFTFETCQADVIFSLIETAIREQKAVARDECEGDTVVANRSPNMPRARSPLPKLPDSAAILEGSYSFKPVFSNAIGSEQCLYSQPPNLIGSEECPYSEPADSIKPKAPSLNSYLTPPTASTLTPSIPLHPCNHHVNRTEPVYADPADILSLTPPRSTPPPPPPTSSSCSYHHDNKPEPFYSEVYDRASPLSDTTQQQKQSQDQRGRNLAKRNPSIVSLVWGPQPRAPTLTRSPTFTARSASQALHHHHPPLPHWPPLPPHHHRR
ncbi:docking protein 2 isoform X2 [Oncorhynchus tshawytscha]|uniref:docking protein 2 isoform X2 n=1 Tax=Oncorhynchus tshawytscha TaxID=74940 RepID=UPI001C3E328C|nr:docking protein 2 isoform X2 [Oncorhynchus tshawytscha]